MVRKAECFNSVLTSRLVIKWQTVGDGMHTDLLDDRSLADHRQERAPRKARSRDDKVRILTLPDARRLAYTEYGERGGYPLFYCHSHGSSRLEAASFHREATLAGYRIIAIDRPGIGLSDFHGKAGVAAFTQDLTYLAEHLHCKRFGLLATGAGTAYALAIADQCPERVSVLLGMSAAFPIFTEQGSVFQRLLRHFAATMVKSSIVLRHWRGALWHGRYLPRLLESLSYADRRVLANPRVLELLENDVREALRQGARGVANDSALQFSSLPLNFEQLHTPCHFWQGSAEGSSERVRAERFIKRLANAQLHEVLNRGRYFYLRYMEDVFAQANVLLDRVKKPQIQQQAFVAAQMPQVAPAHAKLISR